MPALASLWPYLRARVFLLPGVREGLDVIAPLLRVALEQNAVRQRACGIWTYTPAP
jgi:hypothetical protein